jgi:tRNA threonylcarbamoyladenosine modification (KEOPS) complex Cgi121 subunit
LRVVDGVGAVAFEVKVSGEEAGKLLKELRGAFPRLVIQLVSLAERPNSKRIEMIASQTIRSIRKGTLLAGKPEVDVILRLAGTTQISKAISSLGYKGGGTRVMVAAGARSDLKRLEVYVASGQGRYRKATSSRLSKSDLEAIETGALLGANRS